MVSARKTRVRDIDSGESLGFVVHDGASWEAQTIFGYEISRVTTKKEAEEVLRCEGLGYSRGVWQYYDKSDDAWYSCVLREIHENRVVVIRTNALGYEESALYRRVVIDHPTEVNLVKT
ncbi:hypothetical protein I8H83_01405 [Candidatus Saccharibacteria bacterium]|nr:hypothetical protein [Candidatus Saccharibacteria bacterium]MBH2007243.1 hypothetical protein [Candidatus Saccharibacteria bacterium]